MTTKSGKKRQPPPCPACGGTGQVSFFQGESRFLLTTEECPNCFGLGHLLPEEEPGGGRDSDEGEDQSR